jgi:hypothetical protein
MFRFALTISERQILEQIPMSRLDRKYFASHRSNFAPQATAKALWVFLVSPEWHRALFAWIDHDEPKPPDIATSFAKIMGGSEKRKLKQGLSYPSGFQVIDAKRLEDIRTAFGDFEPAYAFLVLHPEPPNDPVVLFKIRNIAVTVDNSRQIQKACGRPWIVGSVRRQLCQALDCDPDEYAFYDRQWQLIPEELDVEQLVSQIKAPYRLHRRSATPHSKPSPARFEAAATPIGV